MEATHFITVQNGVITGRHCGDIGADFYGTPFHGNERIAVPADAAVAVLDRVEYYTPGWKRRPDAELIRKGIMPLPAGYVLDGDGLRRMDLAELVASGQAKLPEGYVVVGGEMRPMTAVERVEAGIDECPAGQKIASGEFVPMTSKEMFLAGQMTEEQYNAVLAGENEAELQRRIGSFQTPEALARAEVNEGYAGKRKAALVALLAVKDQPGWPLEVKWPQ